MPQARKTPNNIEVLGATGTVTPNSRDPQKVMVMTDDVTLNAPSGVLYPGDVYIFRITLGSNTLTLHADYVSILTTPPTILEESVLWVRVKADLSLEYGVLINGA